ncbi:hypothetical protein PQB86_gp213 [Klebsiella phage Miami]|uniref:Uncharacterized protein n=1 Tax=Klebsiella phage Miami TaxID=2767581 RepID=A0A873WGR7_9CAUD|nr:hypothetical protein PQB86_gp213 [Klebsiella phage Miami]QPB09308.1 hypothetical protein CPT_Miami_213 [Klebsiella phage Miami]
MSEIISYNKAQLVNGFELVCHHRTIHLFEDVFEKGRYNKEFVAKFDELEVFLDVRYAIILGRKDKDLTLHLIRSNAAREIVSWDYHYKSNDNNPDNWKMEAIGQFIISDMEQGYFSLSPGYRSDINDLLTYIGGQEKEVNIRNTEISVSEGKFNFVGRNGQLGPGLLSETKPVNLIQLWA